MTHVVGVVEGMEEVPALVHQGLGGRRGGGSLGRWCMRLLWRGSFKGRSGEMGGGMDTTGGWGGCVDTWAAKSVVPILREVGG